MTSPSESVRAWKNEKTKTSKWSWRTSPSTFISDCQLMSIHCITVETNSSGIRKLPMNGINQRPRTDSANTCAILKQKLTKLLRQKKRISPAGRYKLGCKYDSIIIEWSITVAQQLSASTVLPQRYWLDPWSRYKYQSKTLRNCGNRDFFDQHLWIDWEL